MAAPAPSDREARAWPVVVVLAGVIALQVLVAAVSIDVLSAVRAYVTGESLYSKGQKDAQIHLLAYAQSHRLEDHSRFLQSLAAPLGDRQAREALQRDPPDRQAAREGFLAGGNHPDDIAGLIRLFRWFGSTPLMAEPIATWTEGDRLIEQMRQLVEGARASIEAGDVDAEAVRRMQAQAPVLNQQLTELESRFSDQLGAVSRQTTTWLLGLNLALAAALAAASMRFVRHSLQARAAAALEVRRRQESLQLLMDSTAEGLYGIDTEGRCTFANRSALAMLGYDAEADLIGQRIHELIHHSHADGRPYPAGECRIYAAFRQGQATHVSDEVFWRRDGRPVQVEYWSHPVIRDGQVCGAVATFFDVGERLRTQKALRESEQRLSRLVDSVADGVISINGEAQVVLFNRAAERLFRLPAAEAIGQPLGRFLPARPGDDPLDEGPGDLVRRFAAAAPGAGARAPGALHAWRGQRTDGEGFPVEASLSRLDTEQGPLVTIVLRDMSDQLAMHEERKARAALEAASRAKTEFLSRMSHELRTPLNAVIGFAQLLRMNRALPLAVEQLHKVQHIEHAGHHLLALVNDVLDLSRVESGRMSLSLEAVDLHAVAEEAASLVANLAAQTGVQVQRAFTGHGAGGPDAWVVADRVRLRQVLVNLLSNAVKYNRRGGCVTLDYAGAGGMVACTVADDGAGMSSEQLAHLFEPFNRLGAERSTVEGTGIGLVLSRHLVELMRGHLGIDSAPGHGTVATLQLQRASRPASLAPAPFAVSSLQGLDGSLNLLYAEDNEVNVELVRQVAAFRPGVRLRIAASGTIALEMAREDPPELLLVDMHLGDMTGLDLAQALRREPATSRIHLVALSADALPEQIGAALEQGFESYLTKPINFRELLRVLDGYIHIG